MCYSSRLSVFRQCEGRNESVLFRINSNPKDLYFQVPRGVFIFAENRMNSCVVLENNYSVTCVARARVIEVNFVVLYRLNDVELIFSRKESELATNHMCFL